MVKKDFIGMFDILKGILMLLIILGHHLHMVDVWAASPAVHQVIDGLTRYRMIPIAMFFMIAGYDFRAAKDLKQYVKRQAGLLLVPYGISVLAAALLRVMAELAVNGTFRIRQAGAVILGGLYGCEVNMELMGFSAMSIIALWFLPALFLGNCITQILWKLPDEKLRTAAIWGLSLAAISLPSTQQIQLPFFLVQGCAALGFMELGRLMKKKRQFYQPIKPLVLAAAVLSYGFCRLYSQADMATNTWRFWIVDYGTAVLGSLVLFRLYFKTELAVAEHLSVLEYLGRYSLYVLCIHGVELLAFPWYADGILDFCRRLQPEMAVVLGGGVWIVRVAVIMLGCRVINAVHNRKTGR